MPPLGDFDQQIAVFTKRVVSLEARARYLQEHSKTSPDHQELIQELFTTIDELNAAQTEFHQQQNELVAARLRAEEERARYYDLFEFAPDAYLVTDVKGMVQEVNRAGATLLGVAQHYLVGKPLAMYIAKHDIPDFRRRLNDVAYQVGLATWDAQILPRKGSPVEILISMAVIRNNKGEPTALRWQLRDITVRKRMEERIRRLNHELEQRVKERTAHLNEALQREQEARLKAQEANETKLRFLAMVSHELRTPLASIVGFASTLMAADVHWSREDQLRFLEIINHEADKLTELIGQILDVARLESGTLRVQLEEQSFHAMVNGIQPQLEQIVTPHHRLEISIPKNLPSLMMDASRIAQVIFNLVDNAVKYSPPDTTISIQAERRDKLLRVNVRDQGYGIDPEKRRLVFEPFQQVENKEMYFLKGVGLGLAICKGIVEMHGGDIWIETVEGEPGTTFAFILPFQKLN